MVRSRTVRRYLRQSQTPCLQLGAGPLPIPGWLSSDVVSGDMYLDLTRPLPLPDASFAYLQSEHVIEHLPEASIPQLLGELHRILQPGGVVRLTTPDLSKLVALYRDDNPTMPSEQYRRHLEEVAEEPLENPCRAFNNAIRGWGHLFIYDETDLAARLRAAGFEQVESCEPGESAHEPLRGADMRRDEYNRAEVMCLEARRAG